MIAFVRRIAGNLYPAARAISMAVNAFTQCQAGAEKHDSYHQVLRQFLCPYKRIIPDIPDHDIDKHQRYRRGHHENHQTSVRREEYFSTIPTGGSFTSADDADTAESNVIACLPFAASLLVACVSRNYQDGKAPGLTS
jgi:hypothetical protein